MKHQLIAVALSGGLALAGPAHAGGMTEPVMTMEPVMVMEETTASSSADLIIPLILLALVAVAMSGDSGGGPGLAASDMRAKTGITPVGTAANGLPLYHYSYIGSDMVFEGVMAQDVLSHTPEAVTMGADGFYRVDYGMLGIDLKVVD